MDMRFAMIAQGSAIDQSHVDTAPPKNDYTKCKWSA